MRALPLLAALLSVQAMGAEKVSIPSTPQLSHTHAKRLAWHRYVVPPDCGFAKIEELGAVPLGQNGRARYEHFLGLQAPKAFAITEKGGWFFSSGAADAMRIALGQCEKAKARCWLYAVDDRVVWDPDVSARVATCANCRLSVSNDRRPMLHDC